MSDARDVLINLARELNGKTLSNGDNADRILSALAAAGLKVVAREPTMEQGGEHPGVADLWRAMWDAAP